MDGVKRLFGVLMLAMAAWMIARIVSERAALVLWAVPAIAAAIVLWNFRAAMLLMRAAAVLVAVYGVLLLLGAARGADDPLHPLMRSAAADALPFQRYTFTDPEVKNALHPVRLLRANVTANNADDQALLHEFQIYGPPTIAFYDAGGHEQQRYRVVGFMPAAPFAALLRQALTTG